MAPSANRQVLRGQDAWRQHAVFQQLWRHAFPGFKYGAIAFGVFWAAEIGYDVLTKPKIPHVYTKPGTCLE